MMVNLKDKLKQYGKETNRRLGFSELGKVSKDVGFKKHRVKKVRTLNLKYL